MVLLRITQVVAIWGMMLITLLSFCPNTFNTSNEMYGRRIQITYAFLGLHYTFLIHSKFTSFGVKNVF